MSQRGVLWSVVPKIEKPIDHMRIIQPVILCGGSGSRLWPASRTNEPKQFLRLNGARSFFQQAIQRAAFLGTKLTAVERPMIIAGEAHYRTVISQTMNDDLLVGSMILEPVGRDSAPALTLAALASTSEGHDPVLVVTPADQVITNLDAFVDAVKVAINEASIGNIVTFGVAPNRPETGFGYIHVGDSDNGLSFSVTSFKEKPSARTAQEMIEDGGYYWNAGILVVKATVWLNALTFFRRDIRVACDNAWERRVADGRGIFTSIRLGLEEFSNIPKESIDYAVLEKCPGSMYPIKVVRLNAGWDDLGTWDSVRRYFPADNFENVHIGDVVSIESKNTLAYSSQRLIALIGVEDVSVVETKDAILVCKNGRSAEVKQIIENVASDRVEFHSHSRVVRPWGWFETIQDGGCFKVKRIRVNPGARLSLQKHLHRSEHWTVVAGTAEVVIGNTTQDLAVDHSVYIPANELHRLSNRTENYLDIIEVQVGEICSEDDIIRESDDYGRVPSPV